MKEFTKPYLTPEKQIEKISARGLKIDNIELTVNYLRNIGYYRLSGYWYPIRENEIEINKPEESKLTKLDQFQEGATFSNVISIYNYDKNLRMLLLNALEIIEVTIKTDVALQLGQYNIWAYRDSEYFNLKFTKKINNFFLERVLKFS